MIGAPVAYRGWQRAFDEPIKLPDTSAYGCPRSGTGQNDQQRDEECRLNR
jgi:hypothetical protein